MRILGLGVASMTVTACDIQSKPGATVTHQENRRNKTHEHVLSTEWPLKELIREKKKQPDKFQTVADSSADTNCCI